MSQIGGAMGSHFVLLNELILWARHWRGPRSPDSVFYVGASWWGGWEMEMFKKQVVQSISMSIERI